MACGVLLPRFFLKGREVFESFGFLRCSKTLQKARWTFLYRDHFRAGHSRGLWLLLISRPSNGARHCHFSGKAFLDACCKRGVALLGLNCCNGNSEEAFKPMRTTEGHGKLDRKRFFGPVRATFKCGSCCSRIEGYRSLLNRTKVESRYNFSSFFLWSICRI
jgi:hypothetical protein